jgi:signal transduction histidine kinase
LIFRRALLRLTLVYASLQLLLFGIFALAVYAFVTATFDFDVDPADEAFAPDVAEQGFAVLRTALLACYSALVLVVPPMSYLMARVALRPLRASYEAQQQFVDAASHEFRTPLTVLQGEMELALSRDRDPEEYRRVLEGSLEVVDSLNTLTGDLLQLARGDLAELSSTSGSVSLASVARAAVDRQARPGLASVDIEVHREVSVAGSPELLTRALGNIVDNALKFTPPTGQVRVTVGEHAGTAVVRVRDTGVGMDADTAAHAFDRFWRADEARTLPGYGLGLALVEQISRAHGGTAAIVGEPGRGTTVTLTFPLSRPSVSQARSQPPVLRQRP